MKANVEPLEGNRVKLSVEVDEQEFEKALDSAFRRFAREIRVPGFRPGKVPRRLLETRIGTEAARQEALRESLPQFYAQALRDTDLDVIAPPDIDLTSGRDSGPVSFDAVVEVRPQVSIPGYRGLRVTVPGVKVTEEEIDAQIDRLRNQFGQLNPVGRPARDGDHVTIDIKGYRHDQTVEGMTADDFLYEVGGGTVAPELDQHLRGAKPGDIFKFTTTPAGADQEVSFQVLVKDVKEKVLPEVTDEWAAEASEFDTVEELRSDLRARLANMKRMQGFMALRDHALGALVELVDEEPPEALVASEVERRIHDLSHRLEAQGATLAQYLEASGLGQDELVSDIREAAVSAVKADLALRAVAAAEGVEATEEDVEADIRRLAERLEQKPAQLRDQLERAEQMPAVRSDIRKTKALSWLVEHVEVVDEEGHPIDRADLAPQVPVTGAEPKGTEPGERGSPPTMPERAAAETSPAASPEEASAVEPSAVEAGNLESTAVESSTGEATGQPAAEGSW